MIPFAIPVAASVVSSAATFVGTRMMYNRRKHDLARQEKERKERMRKRYTIVASVVLAVAGITAAWFYVANTPIL